MIVYFAPLATSNAYLAAIPSPYDGELTRLNRYSPASVPEARVSGLLVKNVVELALSPATAAQVRDGLVEESQHARR